MTNEDKKLIVKYMGWKLPCEGNIYHAAICAIDADSFCIACEFHHPFDLNDAGLCVEEMQKRGEFAPFYDDLLDTYNGLCEDGKAACGADNFNAWLFNPENFFSAMAAWLKGVKK